MPSAAPDSRAARPSADDHAALIQAYAADLIEPAPLKLIIQIPCFNEEAQLPATLADLPRQVAGFDSVEWLIVDDGSTDRTVEVARKAGVDHIVRLGHNQGLATAFTRGIEACLRLGADVIVNTDADNQYRASGIPALTRPILEDNVQIVVGARPIATIAHFSPLKRMLQRLGSWVVRVASQTSVADAPSGFRAIHRNAAAQLYVFNSHTYTLETIIQAGRQGIPIVSVPIEVNPPTRDSRLIRSVRQYVTRSAITVLRIFVLYKPLKSFSIIAFLLALPGFIAIGRFLFWYAMGQGDGKVQSLILGTGLAAAGAVVLVGGLLADLIRSNRVLLADIRARLLLAEIERTRTR